MINGDVQLDIDKQPRAVVQVKNSRFVQFVMNHSFGIVKDETQASYFLLGFVILAFIFSIISLFGGGESVPQIHIVPAV